MLSTVPLDVDAQLLADPLRARIAALLAAETMCTCYLVEESGARQTTVSHHLRLLREAGWVETESCGRFTYYRLRPEPLRALSGELGVLADATSRTNGRRRPC
jgi:ArsR family transcriptional regulator